MPVTKTAKRALRGSAKKGIVNKIRLATFEKAIKLALKTQKASDVAHAMSQVDRSAKNKIIHKNKAARLKSQLSKLGKKTETKKASKAKKTASKKRK